MLGGARRVGETPPNGMRPVTRFEALLLGAGARLDRFVLDRFVRRSGFAVPADGAALRDRLGRARTFYGDARFADDPAAFFAPPSPLRAHVRRRTRLTDGELLDIAYTTDFAPVFPEARENGRTAIDQLGVA